MDVIWTSSFSHRVAVADLFCEPAETESDEKAMETSQQEVYAVVTFQHTLVNF